MQLKQDITSGKHFKKILTVVVLAVLFIPTLYSAIYLGAFWDPYGKFSNVPVAFVNLDKPISKDGKTYNLGKDLENKLKNDDSVKWSFVNKNQADSGVYKGDYYAEIIIPENFSSKIADVKDGKLDKPQIIYSANKGANFLFSQVSERVAEGIKTEVASNIDEETSKTLVDNLYQVKNSLSDAADGAKKLYDGNEKLLSGSNALTTGIGTAADGSKALKNGLMEAVGGQGQILNGEEALTSGLDQLKAGLTVKNDGPGKVATGASQLSNGITQMKNLVDASSPKFQSQLSSAATGVDGVATYINQANSCLSDPTLNADLKQLKLSQADAKEIGEAEEIISKLQSSDIGDNIGKPLEQASTSMQPLQVGLANAQIGAEQVAAGTSQEESTINNNQTSAGNAVDQLINGANQLQTGTSTVLNGLNEAANKTGQLSAGLYQLNDGSNTLSTGLSQVSQGAGTLNNGLNSGYNTMTSNLKFTSNNMSKYLSNPITVKDTSINNVKYYGEGLAPYFIALSLWLGAMFINIIISLIKFMGNSKNKLLDSFAGKFLLGSILVVVQACILTFTLKQVLNISAVNMGYLYLGCMFISVVFFGIMYSISNVMGLPGAAVTFVLFILQLASSGGTFPIETAPKFYRIINSYIPMTYAINSLRMIISGINHAGFMSDIYVLLTFTVIFLVGSFIIGNVKKVAIKKVEIEEASEVA
jgi:putative membrane protein